VTFRGTTVVDARAVAGGFEVRLADAACASSRLLPLATGVVDVLPPIEGAASCYGKSLFHCPYCDGWEVRDRALAVYGHGARGVGLALALTTWGRDVLLCTDGPARLPAPARERLTQRGIGVRQDRLARLEHDHGRLTRVVFAKGEPAPRDAMFFNTGQYQRSDLAARLGCTFTDKGVIKTNHLGYSGVPGLYVAGDASRDVQFVVVAAAEGAKVGYAMNIRLQQAATASGGASR
jgi:thioredoxin reductase